MDVVGQHTPWTTVCLPRSFIWPHWWNERSNWHCQALDFLAVFTKKHFFRVTEQWPLSQCTNALLHKWSTQQGPVLPSGNAEQEGCHCHIHPALLWTAPQVREEAAGSCMSSSQATGIGKLLPTLQTRACSRAFLYMQWQIIIWHLQNSWLHGCPGADCRCGLSFHICPVSESCVVKGFTYASSFL